MFQMVLEKSCDELRVRLDETNEHDRVTSKIQSII
jgi:hypothetical protein